MQRPYLLSEARSAHKAVVIALSVALLSSLAHASALGELVARERANRDNESVEVYGGSVGKLEAVFLLEWDDHNKIVNGYYYYPARGRHCAYRLDGTNPQPGVLLLREFTPTAAGGEELSANCRLAKRVKGGRVIWEGEMHNTDGRALKMAFSRAIGGSKQKDVGPASGGAIIVDGSEVTLEGLFVTAQGLDEHERLVAYEAIELRKPITIRTEDGLRENISELKLLLEDASPNAFSENAGKILRVTGKVYYAWHGRSSFVNPAKFHASKIEIASDAQD